MDPETWRKHFYWFKGPRGLTVSFRNEWPDIVGRIYLGTLLYHFFLEREMVRWERVPGGLRVTYGPLSGKAPEPTVVSQCVNNHLTVTWGDVLVAENEDRFIPRNDAIYVYSLHGSEREWVLPAAFRGKKLELFTLSKEGRGPAPEYELRGNAMRLKLVPRVPVKIAIRPPAAEQPKATSLIRHVVVEAATATTPRSDTASVIELPDGRLMVAYHKYDMTEKAGDDFGRCSIWSRLESRRRRDLD